MLELTANHVVLVAVIIGVVEVISRLRARDWWACTTLASSALVGLFFGALHYYPDIDWAAGLAAGMAASGIVTLISVKRQSASPSSFVDGK